MKHSFLVPALFFAALCFVTATSCSQKSTSDNSAASKPTPQRFAPDFTVTAPDLYKEVKADYRKTRGKYVGKQIAVTGRVFLVFLNDHPPRILLDPPFPDSVSAEFDEAEKQSIAALEGKNVTIQCLGSKDWYRPKLEHCVVIKVE